ncbi:hypothetical protein B5791_0730 [Bifidobacterium pseudocatenulatum]|nr:hypothetical protein B5791_0730 [Bifidobacterium pseudocatenulatum]
MPTEVPNQSEDTFQSTLSMRRATINGEPVPASVEFQSTLSMRRATYCPA